MTCVCGTGESTETCCLPLIRGERRAETAEQLMRSRYTAYALGEIDHIIGSHDPERVDDVDRASTEAWSKQAEWLGLEILGTEAGGPHDDAGTVDFLARYKMRGVVVPHRERAEFRKHDGHWVFVDGKEIASPPQRREAPRVGRNDPCPCGSGKKHKKCCGQAA
ncbi:MAG TPA: YchJ family protein [Polyangiaceae bacterium]|nr:YchJ family protein [Polyangiaceae bacterium]